MSSRVYTVHPPSAELIAAALARHGTVTAVTNESRPARLTVVPLPSDKFFIVLSNADSVYWTGTRTSQLEALTGAVGVVVLDCDVEIAVVS